MKSARLLQSSLEVREIKPAVPAVVEKQYTLVLNEALASKLLAVLGLVPTGHTTPIYNVLYDWNVAPDVNTQAACREYYSRNRV